jgi:hypothetical protein
MYFPIDVFPPSVTRAILRVNEGIKDYNLRLERAKKHVETAYSVSALSMKLALETARRRDAEERLVAVQERVVNLKTVIRRSFQRLGPLIASTPGPARVVMHNTYDLLWKAACEMSGDYSGSLDIEAVNPTIDQEEPK